MTPINAIIIHGKAYTAESSHPDVIASCHICDLSDYCTHTDREVCAAVTSPTDHFLFSPELTALLNPSVPGGIHDSSDFS